MSNIIELVNVTKNFRLQPESRSLKELVMKPFRHISNELVCVADDITLSVAEGDFLGVIGLNGAGKSTLLKLISGVFYPDRGTIHVTGSISPFIELGVGFQPELSGRDNVFLYGAILGLTRKQIKDRYDAIVSFAELEKFMHQKVRNYSTGMQMRLGFSITSHVDADIFLVDEALAVGDEFFQKKCLSYMDSLVQRKKTIIFVSHDLPTVEKRCNRLAVLERGRLVAVGAPSDVIKYHMPKKVT